LILTHPPKSAEARRVRRLYIGRTSDCQPFSS
jgi:hypothetical protein